MSDTEGRIEMAARELWHVAMPGYFHPGPGPDEEAYRRAAQLWLETGDPPFGEARYAKDLYEYLRGGGVVACGLHDRTIA